ncbi:hypothetical protein [Arsukibacterium sp.]|uniref:hypothetical protein n=1 Tax=Arsukibacterium sp. TaxID=1977258 RepID=UPI002FDB783D
MTLEINGIEQDVTVNVLSYTPYQNGSRGHIDDWMPDEPEQVEIEVLLNGADITDLISEADFECLENEAIEYIRGERDYD